MKTYIFFGFVEFTVVLTHCGYFKSRLRDGCSFASQTVGSFYSIGNWEDLRSGLWGSGRWRLSRRTRCQLKINQRPSPKRKFTRTFFSIDDRRLKFVLNFSFYGLLFARVTRVVRSIETLRSTRYHISLVRIVDLPSESVYGLFSTRARNYGDASVRLFKYRTAEFKPTDLFSNNRTGIIRSINEWGSSNNSLGRASDINSLPAPVT